MLPKKLVSVVVPCFNESQVLPLLYDRLRQLEVDDRYELEVVFIDDGSSDDTWQQLSAFCEAHAGWQAIRLSRNFGHQQAVWTGLEKARGDAVFVIDADLQDPPELLNQFLAKWQQGAEVVYGVRRKRKEALWKRAAYYAFYRLLGSISDNKIPLDAGDFCLMDRCVVNEMLKFRDPAPFVRGIRAWVGFRQEPFEYERSARAAGKEKYSLRMLIDLAINGMLGFSRKPSRWMISTGVVFMVTAVMIAALAGTLAATSVWIPNLTVTIVGSLLVAGMLISGVQLIATGVVGDYISRIYETTNQRPVSVIKEITGPVERENNLSVTEFESIRQAA